MGIEQFNKTISLYFLDENGRDTGNNIICPARGRKPEIELVGTFQPSLSGGAIPEFTITVTNLYLDILGFQYPKVKVVAGYEGNTIEFSGSIMSMFRESPGPDGKTVICCYLGTISGWLDSYLETDCTAGTPLKDVLAKISQSLGLAAEPIIPAELAGLTLLSKFAESGTASSVLDKLLAQFPSEGLGVAEDNGTLHLYSNGTPKTYIKRINIDYLSSPPQTNPGGENGAYYTAFTAPWNPQVRPGVKAVFPAWQYVKNLTVVNSDSTNMNAVNVEFVQIHFSTTGSANQMQVQGVGVKV